MCTNGSVIYRKVDDPAFPTPINSGEVLQFWLHLSAAELIPGFYDGVSLNGTNGSATSGMVGTSFPLTKMDRYRIGVYGSRNGRNYFQLGNKARNTHAYRIQSVLTPEEAYNIDAKMDDGRPGVGVVVARGSNSGVTGTAPNRPLVASDDDLGVCVNEDISTVTQKTSWSYALTNSDFGCSLRFKMN